MANVLVDSAALAAIADAIRAKNGSDSTYKPREMAAAIAALEAGSGGAAPDPVLTLVEDNATERVTSTTGRYWAQTGTAYKVRLKKYTVTKGAKYKITATRAMSYATCWFGDEFPELESYVNYVGLPISQTEWTVEATGNRMMVSFTATAAIASSVMKVAVATA